MFPPVRSTITLFQTTLTVFDVATTTADGRAVKTLGDDYTIKGVIQPATPETIVYMPEGEKIDGAKLIHSKTKLNVGETYLRYDGLVYKLNPIAKWGESTNGGFYRYICPEINERSVINE